MSTRRSFVSGFLTGGALVHLIGWVFSSRTGRIVLALFLTVILGIAVAGQAHAEEGAADQFHSANRVSAYKVEDGVAKGMTATMSAPPDHGKFDKLSPADKGVVDCIAVAAMEKNDQAIKNLPCFKKVNVVFSDPSASARQKRLAASAAYRWPCLDTVKSSLGPKYANISQKKSEKRCKDAQSAVRLINTSYGPGAAQLKQVPSGQDFWDKLTHPKSQAARAVAGDAAGDAVANPKNLSDTTEGKFKQGATSMMNVALDTVVHGTQIDASASWFKKSYSYSAGLGLVILVTALYFALAQYSATSDQSETIGDVFKWALIGMAGLGLGPLLIGLVTSVTNALEIGILNQLHVDKAGWKSSLMHPITAMTSTGNGIVWVIVMCVLAILAGAAIWISFLLQTVVIYVGGTLLGVAFGAFGHRNLRSAAMRSVMMVASLLFMRPIFLLILWTCSSMSAHFNEMTTLKQTSTDGFVALGLSLTVMVVVAFAPFKLLKLSPLQLDSGRAAGVGDGHRASSALLAGAAGLTGAGLGAAVVGGGKLAGAGATVKGSSRSSKNDGKDSESRASGSGDRTPGPAGPRPSTTAGGGNQPGQSEAPSQPRRADGQGGWEETPPDQKPSGKTDGESGDKPTPAPRRPSGHVGPSPRGWGQSWSQLGRQAGDELTGDADAIDPNGSI